MMHIKPALAVFAAPKKRSRLIWSLGALGAIGLHAGCFALAAARFTPTDLDDDLGAPAIEVGVELEAPHLEPTDLPPGPEADASAASAAMTEQIQKVEQSALPKAEPTETDDPDRQVAREEIVKPEEKKPEVAKAQSNASSESIAAEATAAPSSEVLHEAAVAKAPAQGLGASAQRIRATWQKELLAHLGRHKRYPAEAIHRNLEILVNFTLDRVGHVLSATIKKSSGDAQYDEAALAMMRRADPAPAPPPLVADEGLNFTLPVVFRDKGRL
jgi:periplasmic protein TonB